MSQMTEADRARLRALCEAATDLPWHLDEFDTPAINDVCGRRVAEAGIDEDAGLIVAAVNALPALLDAMDDAEANYRFALDHAIGTAMKVDQRDAEIERLRAALRIIAGIDPPYDNLLGHADLARLALADAGPLPPPAELTQEHKP